MPEGDTVWGVARRLHDALAGRTLLRSELRVPRLATLDLAGAHIVEVVPRGKHLLMRMEHRGEAITLRSHLRMEGVWELYDSGARWRGYPSHWIRAVLRTEDRVAVGYRLAMLEVVRTERESALVGHLGPDVLDETLDRELVLSRLRTAPDRPIAETLLDQRVVSGLGTNLIAEACFVCGVAPQAPVSDARTARVLDRAIAMARFNRGRTSRVTTGDVRQPSWVHSRHDCRRCGTVLLRVEVGRPPRQRSIAYCPRCQSI